MSEEGDVGGYPQFNFQLSSATNGKTIQMMNQIQQQQPIYFGDQICVKSDSFGSMKYMHSDGFYPACIKCIDYSDMKDDLTDIDGAVFEICNPAILFGSKAPTNQSGSTMASSPLKNQKQGLNAYQNNAQGLATSAFFNSVNVSETLGRSATIQQKSIIDQSNNPQSGSGMINVSNQQGYNQQRDDKWQQKDQNSNQGADFDLRQKNAGGDDDSKWLNGEETIEDQQIALCFYQNFILKHKRSHKYLYLVEEDLEHYSLVLSETPSLFKISPSFKSQVVQTKKVYYNQFIYIQAVPLVSASNKDIYLVKDEATQYVNSAKSSAPGGGGFVSPKFADYTCFFGDFFFSPNQKTCFHLEPYRENPSYINNKMKGTSHNNSNEDIKFLRYGDIVKVFHIETDSFLQYTDDTLTQFKSIDINGDANVVQEVENDDDSDSQTNPSFSTFQQRQKAKGKETIQIKQKNKQDQVFFCKSADDVNFNDSYTLWKLINPLNPLDGDYIRWEEKVVLKCVNKNVFLHIKERNYGKTTRRVIRLKSSITDEEECHFHLCEDYALVDNQGDEGQSNSYNYLEHLNYIKFNSIFRIVHTTSNLTLSVKFQNDFEAAKVEQEQQNLPNLASQVMSQLQSKSRQNSQNSASSMTQSIVDRSYLPKLKQNAQTKIQQESTPKSDGSEENLNIDECQKIVLKENFCQGDVLRFQEVDEIELIQNNYLASTFELISSAIPLIKYYALISEKKDESSSKNIFQFTNPYFTEFIGLLKSSIQHQIKYLLDIDQNQDIVYEDSVFKKHKPNSEKQDLSSKRGILEYSVNLLRAMWGYQSESKIQEILQCMNKDEEEQGRAQSKIQHQHQSFISVGGGRRSTQIKQFKSKIDQKDEQLQLYNTFRQLSRLIYFLIITLCKNNSAISINTFNYFTFFKNHVGYSIGATTAIISILRNNEKLLNLIHSKNYSTLYDVKETISRTLKKLNITQLSKKNQESFLSANWKQKQQQEDENKQVQKVNKKKYTLINIFFKKYEQVFQSTKAYWTNFMDVMNIICICKDEALNINQLMIGQELLANQDPVFSKNLQKMIIQLECKEKQIFIKAHKKTYELSDFLKQEQQYFEKYKCSSNEYVFLMKQLELYANLCNGRNYQNKILLEDKITAQALIHYITDQQIKIELRATLLNLFINLHFDSCPRKEIQRPCFTKSLNVVKQKVANGQQNQASNYGIGQYKKNDSLDQGTRHKKNWGSKGIELTSSYNTENNQESDANNKKGEPRDSRADSEESNQKNDKTNTSQISLEQNLLTKRNKRFKSQRVGESEIDENGNEEEFEDFEEDYIQSPSKKKADQLFNIRNIKPNLRSIINTKEKGTIVLDEANIGIFLTRDSMENQQEMKQFVVNYLRYQIFSTTGQLKNDILSYYVVKLARMMITFDYFKREEEEFLQIIESLLVILQTQSKVPILEKLKNVYTKNKEQKMKLEEQEKCKLMIIQEVLQTLLYYQSICTDGNLRSLLEFISLSLQTKLRPANCTSKMDLDIHVKNMVESRLVHYLPKLQNISAPSQSETIDIRFNVSNNSNCNNSSNPLCRNKSVLNFTNCSLFYQNKHNVTEENRKSQFGDKEGFMKYMSFDDMLKNNSFFNIILKNFVSVGSSNIKTSHLILKILFANFSQRQNIIRSLKKLQVITSEKEFIIFKYLKYLNIKVGFISEMQELWFRGDAKTSISQQSAFNEINDLMEQMNLGFFETSEFDSQQEALVSTKPLCELIKKGKISFSRQQMMRNIKMHKSILSIIREGNIMIYDINKLDESHGNSREVKEMINNLYKNCYIFLQLFVTGNRSNQKTLFNYFDLFLQNVGETDYGQYKLMGEIIKNNKKICHSLTPEFIQKYITSVFKNGQKNNLEVIKFFENLIYDYDEPAYQNIDKFVKCLFETEEFSNFFGLKLVQSEQIDNQTTKSKIAEMQGGTNADKLEIFLQSDSPLKKSIASKQGQEQISKFIYSLPGQYEFNISAQVINILSGQNGELTPSAYRLDDIPFIYHQKSIEVANSILKHCINPTKFRYLFTKLININYMYKLLALDDIFVNVNDQTILFSFFKTTLMEFIKQVWLVNEKNSAKLNKNHFLIEFLKKETNKFYQIKENVLVSYKEAMSARNGKEKILYLQNAFAQSPSLLGVDINSRQPSEFDSRLIRPSDSITVSVQPNKDEGKAELPKDKQQITIKKEDNKQQNVQNNNDIITYAPPPYSPKNRKESDDNVMKTFMRTSQKKFDINVGNDTEESDEERKDNQQVDQVVSSFSTQKTQNQIHTSKTNPSPFGTITEEKQENEDSKIEPEVNYVEEVVLQTQTDYFIYLFQHLTPFIMDTFKCFIGYDSQQANVNNRADYEAFALFAKEFTHFCEFELTEDIFRNYKDVMIPVLIEFQEIFKIKINFSFDCKLDILKYQQEKSNKKQVKADEQKSEQNSNTRSVLDSRIQGIIQPLDEEYIQREEKKLKQEVSHIALHLLNSNFVNDKLIIQERNHLVYALRDGHRANNLSLQSFLKKLVTFVKNAIDELENDEGIIAPDDQVLMDTIQLLCDILDSCVGKEELIYMQNFLNKHGIIKAMVKFFSQKNEIGKVFKSFITLGVRMIQGDNCANYSIQESIYQGMIAQPNIENFFAKISEIIKQEIHFQAFENMSISQKIEAECKSVKFSYNKHRKFSILKILRFLQLLIANCYSKMQRYLQNQSKSRTSHNILFHIVDLVEAYIGGRGYSQQRYNEGSSYVTDANTCDKVVMALETLILLIQGPCVENQIELAESKFLEIATYILKLNDSYEQFTRVYKNQNSNEVFIENEQSILQIINMSTQSMMNGQHFIQYFKQKLTERQKQLIDGAYEVSPLYSQCLSSVFHEDHPSNYGVWMLSQIKNKCISCLESLMDGENKLITKRIMADIPPNLLKLNLAWIYEKYEILYGDQEYFDYDLFDMQEVKVVNSILDNLVDEEQKVRESLKQSFIIDSGFKIFKLLRFMLNQIGSNEVEVVYNEIAKSQALILQRQSKKNIFSQLHSLFNDFVKIFQKMYQFIKKREDLAYKVNKQKINSNMDKNKQRSLEFFSKYTGQIEIVQEDVLLKIQFPKYPHCFSLTNDLKYKVTGRLNLYSPHTKVESIVGYSDTFIERLKFEHQFIAKLEKNFLVTILSNNLDLWKNLSYIVCIVQNVLIVLYQKREPGESVFQFKFIGTQNKLQLIFQLAQITLASLVFFFFILKKVPLINKKTNDKILQIEQKKFSINEHTLYQNVRKTDYKTKLRNIKIKTILFFNDVELVYFLAYFSLALIGMFNEFFLALLLFDIFWRFPMLLSILHAVWRPRKSIILTMFLFIICTYIFSLTAYYFFEERFNHLCDSLLTCYSVIFDYMYKNDGGITSYFSPNGPDDFVNYYGVDYNLNWGSLWDFLYFFIIITLLFSIVSGIIIDTFGLLRDEEDENKRNKKDFCLVCSIDRATIDKLSPHNQGFQHHIDVEHNMWNYIFYISYLSEKNRNYFLGAEQDIYQKVKQKDTSWFPLNRSLTINQNQESNEEIENLNRKMNSMESRFTRILQQILKNTKVSNQKIQKIDQQQDLQQRNLFQNSTDNASMLMSTRMLSSQSKKLPTPLRNPKRSQSVWIPTKNQSDQIIEEEEVIQKLNTSLISNDSNEPPLDLTQQKQHPTTPLQQSKPSAAANKLTSLINRCESEDEL